MKTSHISARMALLTDRARRIDQSLREHWLLSIVLLTLFALLKTGPRPLFGWSPFDHGVPLVPGGNRPWISVIPEGLKIAGTAQNMNLPALAVSFGLALGFLCALAVVTVRRFPRRQVVWLWTFLILGSPGLILLAGAGSLDGLFLVGAAALVLGQPERTWVVPLAVFVMVYANPGQSVLAGISLLLLSFLPDFRFLRLRAILVASSGFVLAMVEALMSSGESQARSLPELVSLSLNFSLFTLPLRLLTIYGVFWLVIVLFLLALPRRDAVFAAAALVIVPILATLITLDGTRVGIGVSSLAFFAVLTRAVPVGERYFVEHDIPMFIPIALAAVAPLPIVWMNTVEVPWVFFVDVVHTLLGS